MKKIKIKRIPFNPKNIHQSKNGCDYIELEVFRHYTPDGTVQKWVDNPHLCRNPKWVFPECNEGDVFFYRDDKGLKLHEWVVTGFGQHYAVYDNEKDRDLLTEYNKDFKGKFYCRVYLKKL